MADPVANIVVSWGAPAATGNCIIMPAGSLVVGQGITLKGDGFFAVGKVVDLDATKEEG